jgi:hypothetical protein
MLTYPIRIWRSQVETSQAWTAPAEPAGGLFLGLAGVKRAMNSGRNAKENLAMMTDLFVAGVVGNLPCLARCPLVLARIRR